MLKAFISQGHGGHLVPEGMEDGLEEETILVDCLTIC